MLESDPLRSPVWDCFFMGFRSGSSFQTRRKTQQLSCYESRALQDRDDRTALIRRIKRRKDPLRYLHARERAFVRLARMLVQLSEMVKERGSQISNRKVCSTTHDCPFRCDRPDRI